MKPSQGPQVEAQCFREPDPQTDALTAALRATLDAVIDAVGRRVESAVRDALTAVPATPAAAPFAERLLTAEECAARIGVDLRTWRRLEKNGQAPRGLRLGRRVVRWHPAVVDAWAQTGVVPAAPIEHTPVAPVPRRRARKNVFAAAKEHVQP